MGRVIRLAAYGLIALGLGLIVVVEVSAGRAEFAAALATWVALLFGATTALRFGRVWLAVAMGAAAIIGDVVAWLSGVTPQLMLFQGIPSLAAIVVVATTVATAWRWPQTR